MPLLLSLEDLPPPLQAPASEFRSLARINVALDRLESRLVGVEEEVEGNGEDDGEEDGQDDEKEGKVIL